MTAIMRCKKVRVYVKSVLRVAFPVCSPSIEWFGVWFKERDCINVERDWFEHIEECDVVARIAFHPEYVIV